MLNLRWSCHLESRLSSTTSDETMWLVSCFMVFVQASHLLTLNHLPPCYLENASWPSALFWSYVGMFQNVWPWRYQPVVLSRSFSCWILLEARWCWLLLHCQLHSIHVWPLRGWPLW
ncbi:hypothetical protein O6H91_Y217400 [Diphasiastrum complanatum]|nr:hypothetical protein O6H91_Y217400 [Diphasiastrum complanatum]